MSEALVDRIEAAAEQVFPGTPVLFAYLFGSLARGRATPRSDVDVAVFVEDFAAPDAFDLSLRLPGELSQVSGFADIDLIVLNDAPLPLKGRAVQERLVLYSRDEPRRVAFESLTLREFFDFQIHAVPLNEGFLRDIASGRR